MSEFYSRSPTSYDIFRNYIFRKKSQILEKEWMWKKNLKLWSLHISIFIFKNNILINHFSHQSFFLSRSDLLNLWSWHVFFFNLALRVCAVTVSLAFLHYLFELKAKIIWYLLKMIPCYLQRSCFQALCRNTFVYRSFYINNLYCVIFMIIHLFPGIS